MKVYVLVVLLVCCVLENASAAGDWKNNVKINHMQHINSIVNDALTSIRSDVNQKNTPAAEQCYENARLSLRSASQTGYSQISSCVASVNNAGDANVCCQQFDNDVFNQSLQVIRDADACLKNA